MKEKTIAVNGMAFRADAVEKGLNERVSLILALTMVITVARDNLE